MAKSLHLNGARWIVAGWFGVALALPMAASADKFHVAPGLAKTIAEVARPALPPPPPEAEQAIRDKAANSLGIAFTGPAVSGLETVPGSAARIRYQNCDIYYSRGTGAHEVHGDIRAKYNARGGPWSGLGLPTTDELRTNDSTGRYNDFSNSASIYWSPNTGPMVVRGDIRSIWKFWGAEHGPMGYPTTDERELGSNRRYSDFQNELIYWEGDRAGNPEIASLTRAQMLRAVRKLLKPRANMPIDSMTITEVSDTGYGFSQSRNRLVTFHIEGRFVNDWWFDGDYTLDLRILFFAKKEADGSTTLRVAVDGWRTETFNPSYWSVMAEIHPLAANPDVAAISKWLYAVFNVPPKLINFDIPAPVNVLSFKVRPDGGLRVYLQPGDAGAVARAVIQRDLNDMAK